MIKSDLIGMNDLKKYNITEVIRGPNGEFIFILMVKSADHSSLFAKIRYIKVCNTTDTIFEAYTVEGRETLSSNALALLEYDLILTAEEIRKCMFAKNVMKQT